MAKFDDQEKNFALKFLFPNVRHRTIIQHLWMEESIGAEIKTLALLKTINSIRQLLRKSALKNFHQVALARRQRNDLSVFESSCHVSNCLVSTKHGVGVFVSMLKVKKGSYEYQLIYPDRESHRSLSF